MMSAMAGSTAASGGDLPVILCCVCGVEIQQNPANMCVGCLRDSVDITEGINKQLTLHSCRSCDRFLCPPWQSLELESKELMAVCLRKIAGLSKVKLVDAVWIWTEPHSMRLKIKLTLQKEVLHGAILQQATVVDFVIRNQQCKNCEASYAQGAWHAVVQVRQRVSHKRTFLFLEQLLLKNNAHSETVKIVTFRDGIDFYFREKNQAMRFIDFLDGNVPLRQKYSRKLVSADHRSNVGDFKHNFLIDIAPICKDDLVILPADLARNLSNISRLVVIKRIAAGLHVVDPFTGERNEVNAEKYWRYGFDAVMSGKQLTRYVVLSVEPLLTEARPSAKQRGADRKMRRAEVVVARERDITANDTQFIVETHLGHLLREGDVVMGYDLTNANWNVDEDPAKAMRSGVLPEVVLVRKYYPPKGERRWELKQLEADERVRLNAREQQEAEEDLEVFMQEVEGDREMRANINLYRSAAAAKEASRSSGKSGVAAQPAQKRAAAAADAMDDGGAASESEEELDEEQVRLDELLDDMTLGAGAAAGADGEEEAKILDASQAAAVKALDLHLSPFDEASYDPKDYKF